MAVLALAMLLAVRVAISLQLRRINGWLDAWEATHGEE
jgi:hypothetical protein